MHLRPLTALTALCLRALGRHKAASPWNSGELIRAELYSVERLEQHAANLAAAQRIATRSPVRRSLAGRLRANERILLDAYRSIAAAVSDGLPITPAAEWLLDNYHLVEEQIREIRQDLPPSFYRALPKLEDGPWRGYPRVFAVAWAFVAHTDSRFDPDSLRRFLAAYQGIALLTIGELWAIAITLRIVLIENLRRAACSIVLNRDTRQEADAVADRLLGVGARATFEPDALLRRAAGGGEFSAAFIVQLVKRLRDQDPKVTPALQWLEQRVTAQGSTFEELVRSEHQKQGASNVTVRNIFTSMRLLSDLDWAKFFESVSRVDATLREYAGFAAMDFPTRNLYRGAIEGLARGCSQNEVAVAAAALAASRDAAPESRAADPGFHLIYEGRRRFEEELGYRAPLSSLPRRLALRGGLHVYVGAIACIAVVLLCVPLVVIGREDIGWLPFLALGLAGSIPAWDAAVALVNRGAARFFGATLLPGMSLRGRHPARLQDFGGGAGLVHVGAGDRCADRSFGGAFPGVAGWRAVFRPAVGLVRFRHAIPGDGPAAPRARDRSDRPFESVLRPPGEARTVPAAAPAAGVERRPALLDGLGAQARQAARSQPPAAGCDRHDVRGTRRSDAAHSRGGTPGHYAGCGHPPAARLGAPPDRQDGASPEPAGVRCRQRSGAARLCGFATARGSLVAGGYGGVALPADLRERGRHRSLCGRGIRRVPGSVRRRLVRREGHLRRRCLPGRVGRARPGW